MGIRGVVCVMAMAVCLFVWVAVPVTTVLWLAHMIDLGLGQVLRRCCLVQFLAPPLAPPGYFELNRSSYFGCNQNRTEITIINIVT